MRRAIGISSSHLREHPVVIHEALATIAENLAAHMRDVIDAGADGIFFALQGCSRTIMTEQQYRSSGGRTISWRCAGVERLAEHPARAW